MNKKLTAIGLSAGLLAGAGAGFLLEMSGSAGAASNGVTAVTVATDDTTSDSTGSTDTGAATDTDRAADHAAHLQDALQPLIDDGSLTQEQVDKVIAALEAAGPMGGGHGGPGGPGMGMGGNLDAVATVIGITTDELQTALQGGQTLAEIAVANGSTAQAVIDALVAELQAHFDEEVAAGEHTQEDADARIAEATTRITDMVNNGAPAGGSGMGGPGMGGRGHHGHDGDGDDASGDTGTSGGTIDGGPQDTQTSADA
ncbi:MAG: hypothetical protein RL238_2022 [Actinomycetota bacterium]|jgi:hypothetical protein